MTVVTVEYISGPRELQSAVMRGKKLYFKTSVLIN